MTRVSYSTQPRERRCWPRGSPTTPDTAASRPPGSSARRPRPSAVRCSRGRRRRYFAPAASLVGQGLGRARKLTLHVEACRCRPRACAGADGVVHSQSWLLAPVKSSTGSLSGACGCAAAGATSAGTRPRKRGATRECARMGSPAEWGRVCIAREPSSVAPPARPGDQDPHAPDTPSAPLVHGASPVLRATRRAMLRHAWRARHTSPGRVTHALPPQRRRRCVRRRPRAVATPLPPRRGRRALAEGRLLPASRMRMLHGRARRQGGDVVRHAHESRRGQVRHDHRGPRRIDPGHLCRGFRPRRWSAVRLLHSGHRHAGAGPVAAQAGPHRRGGRQGPQRAPVPVHRLQEDRRIDPHCRPRTPRRQARADRGTDGPSWHAAAEVRLQEDRARTPRLRGGHEPRRPAARRAAPQRPPARRRAGNRHQRGRVDPGGRARLPRGRRPGRTVHRPDPPRLAAVRRGGRDHALRRRRGRLRGSRDPRDRAGRGAGDRDRLRGARTGHGSVRRPRPGCARDPRGRQPAQLVGGPQG